MKNTKKFICLLMALAMLALTAVGCRKDGEEDDDTAESETAAVETEGIGDDELELPDDLYFDGQTFTMLIRSDRNGSLEEFSVDIEAVGLSVVDQAVYDRQMSIQDKLGIQFVYTTETEAKMYTAISNAVNGGTNSFDVACPAAERASDIAKDGLGYNWLDVPYVNMEKVWWGSRSGMAESLTINGQLPFITGDASSLSIGKALAVFFNKELLDVYAKMSDEQMYELVKSGEWTIDKLIEVAKLCGVDNDGDGAISSKEDIVGNNFYLLTIADGYFGAFDLPIVVEDSNGEYEVAMNNRRMLKAVEKLHEMVWGANCTYLATNDEGKYGCIQFFAKKQQAMFTHGGLEWAPEFLTLGFENYGIIPYPKLDTDQETYGTSLSGVYSAFVIDKTAGEDKIEKIGAVMEYLGYLSYNNTTYAYYDVLLKGRAAQDPQSVEMLDLIHDGIRYDRGFMYSWSLGHPGHVFREVLKTNANAAGTWQTHWSQNGKNYNSKLDTLLQSFGVTQ